MRLGRLTRHSLVHGCYTVRESSGAALGPLRSAVGFAGV
jgi:hypothetical protein